ncbi:hypothetical protein PoB_003070400 [Plakobranchus ocellatus]|uniref:Uncharacterized protein n=1 Tax=Plakobranchus ocellatus TaxID=259542 RepID=A0AAV4ADA1_9GAST|nr:hypothetical protein PoB_003070400 [Plakobranchus ocellatus]
MATPSEEFQTCGRQDFDGRGAQLCMNHCTPGLGHSPTARQTPGSRPSPRRPPQCQIARVITGGPRHRTTGRMPSHFDHARLKSGQKSETF